MVNPKLRFKRPDGTAYPDWEERSMEDVLKVDTIRNGGKYAADAVLSVSDEYGIVNQIALQGRSFAAEDVSNYKVVKKEQIVYTRSPLKAKPYGIIKIVGDEEGIVSPLYIVNTVKDGCVPGFIYEYFNLASRTNNYLKAKVRMGAKHTMNISEDEWLSGSIVVPCYEEQERIVNLLESIDEKTLAQEQHVTALETQKKELLRQVFAREIRFKDENGQDYPQWEEHPLSDYLSFQNGVNADREAYGKGVKLISVRDILSGRPIMYDMISGAVQIDDATLSRYSVAYGDVLFQRSSENYEDAGTANVYLDDKIATFSGFVIRGKKIAEYNPVFMYCALNDACVRKQITRKAQGAQHVNVGQDTLASVIISVPSLPEQQRIADFFTALDAQIENERALLEDWRQLKKGLLQQMFVK